MFYSYLNFWYKKIKTSKFTLQLITTFFFDN